MPRPTSLLPRLALATAALLGASSAHAAGEDRLRTTVEGAIRPLMAQHDIPGMFV